jgi:formyl-CoA transferase/CoA:oxalate CoA-transferase
LSGESEAVLEGIRVVELATLIAAPYGAALLGDMGAEMVKVEHPLGGDPARQMGPPFVGGQSALFLGVNRNKRSMALDVRAPRGRRLLHRLLEGADVFIVNLRPDATHEFGADYETARGVNDRIVYCAVTAFGEEGPYRLKPATDNIFQGMGGLMMVTGEEDDPPVRVGVTPADMKAATYVALGVVSALFSRQRTGRGQRVAVSLMDSLLALQTPRLQEFLVTGRDPVRMGAASPFAAPSEFFETRDGAINISVHSDKLWRRFCNALGLASLAVDPRFGDNGSRLRNRGELAAALNGLFRQRETAHWRRLLDEADIPNGPIYRYWEMLDDPHIARGGTILEVAHAAAGPVKLVNQPIRFAQGPTSVRRPPPLLGEHTAEVLGDLGLSPQEMEALEAAGVIALPRAAPEPHPVAP